MGATEATVTGEQARQELDQRLASTGAHVAELAREARDMLADLVPGAVESYEGGDFGIGTSDGYAGLAFVVTPRAESVRVGIPHGAALDDPAGLLEGRGKVHRHLTLASIDELRSPQVRDVFSRAATAALTRAQK